jgi:CRISPR system Cascade subunit CasD
MLTWTPSEEDSQLMPNKYAILVLQGLMQSWGLQGKFDYRDTASLPTKSGVVGLICAALGIERDDRTRIAEIASLDMSVITIKRGTLMEDFHTAGCGAVRDDARVQRASGGDTQAVTRRKYLADASFAVVVFGNPDTIDRVAVALDNPKWGTYLGRRSCIPSRPILEGVVDTEEQVKTTLTKLGVKSRAAVLSDGVGKVFQNDVPIDFKTRTYRMRPVVQESVFVR